MATVTDAELEKEIGKILTKASEESKSTTLKSVRLELEKKFAIELADRKQFISKTITECLKKMEEESEEESEKEKEEEEEEEEEEVRKKPPKRAASKAKTRAAPKPKRKKAASDDEDSDSGKKSKGKKKGGGKGKGNGYTRPWKLSPALSELLGEDKMPRYEVVKKMWALIKERNLYDPNNKQFALCDDGLYSVIGTKRFRIFAMMKYLKNHFLDD